MITLAESGLTEEQYNALLEARQYPAFKVVASPYMPHFSDSGHTFTADLAGAWQENELIYYVDGTTPKTFNLETGVTTALTVLPSTTLTDFALTKDPESDTIRIFGYSDAGISLSESTDGGVTWGAWSQILTPFPRVDINDDAVNQATNGANAWASSTYSTQVVANLFDNNTTTAWSGYVSQLPITIRYDFGTAKVMTRMTVTAHTTTTRTPKNFTIRGSQDATNWTTLYTGTNVTWTASEKKEFSFSNVTGYRYYSLYITSVNGDPTYVTLREMELIEDYVASLDRVYAITGTSLLGVYRYPGSQMSMLMHAHYDSIGAAWGWTETKNALAMLDGLEVLPAESWGDNANPLCIMELRTSGGVRVKTSGTDLITTLEVAQGLYVAEDIDTPAFRRTALEVVDPYTSDNRITLYNVFAANGFYFIFAETLWGRGIFKSKDGYNWSRFIPLGHEFTKLLYADEMVYGITEAGDVWEAYSTHLFGAVNSSIAVDITDDVKALSINRREMGQLKLQLENNQLQYDDHEAVRTDADFILDVNLGYWLDGEEDPAFVPAGIFYADEIQQIIRVTESGYDNQLQVTASDIMSFLSVDRVTDFRFLRSAVIEVDEYEDTSGTEYGGLKHTVIHSGTWEAASGELSLTTNNETNFVFSTLATHPIADMDVSVNFAFTSANTDQFAGLVFRAVNEENFFYAIWNKADSKVYLYRRRDAVDTLLKTSSAYAGTTSMRVTCLGSDISIYAGSNLALEFADIITAEPTLVDDIYQYDLADMPFLAGFVGVIAKGQA